MTQHKNIFLLIVISFFIVNLVGQNVIQINLQEGEKVWAGVVFDGHFMPFSKDYSMDLYGNNKSNQIQPLLLTSKGQYIWSEEPFIFEVKSDKITITDRFKNIETGSYGENLSDVQRYVSNKYFKASGLIPDSLMFTAPQYNTWIELNYNHNQKDILQYAKAIIDNGMPPGVLMIDDTWQEDYGLWDFHPGRFPNPKEMINQLHAMGFKVMLWVCPFVSADQKLLFYHLKEKGALLKEKSGTNSTWETAYKPIMIWWWNGISAELDLSHPEAVNWFNAQLDRLVEKYNVDGFKFDAADYKFYPENSINKGSISPNRQSEIYAQLGLRFPFNEFRACWKMGGQPLVQRLHDKAHTWSDLQMLIPQIIVQGMFGYPFCCPDMIGGGLLGTFKEEGNLSQDLIVRSAQCQALMPMMQFSVAPWRVLDSTHLASVKDVVKLRTKFAPLILKLAKQSSHTGDPIVKNMEFVFPNQGYVSIINQFMLGDTVLVAPMLEDKSSRNVTLPKGKWIADDGTIYKGGKTYEVLVPLNRLPYFMRIK